MGHPPYLYKCSYRSKILLVLVSLSLFACRSLAQSPAQKFSNLQITCSSEGRSREIYQNKEVTNRWRLPPDNPAYCRPNPIVIENSTDSRRNIELRNVHQYPRENPVKITSILATTKDKQIISVNCSHNSITVDTTAAYLFTITTKCLPLSANTSKDWGLVNVTLYSSITNEQVTFYYQKLCGPDYETRFEWGYIVLFVISILLVGIGSRTVTTVIDNDELKVIHVFIYVAVFTGCNILLYYWALEIELPARIVFCVVAFLAAAFVVNSILKHFIGQGDCLLTRWKFLCFGKIKLTNIISLLFAGGMIAAWWLKGNWIVGDILAISLLLALMRLAKVPSMKVGVALLVFVFASHAIWASVAYVLQHPIDSHAGSLIGLPLSINFPRLFSCPPTNGTCSGIAITDSIFPGLFIAYCYRYDKAKGLKLFYLGGMLGYIFGMTIHTALFFAGGIRLNPILYVGPCILLFVSIIAFRRNEHKDIWDGLQSEKEFVAHLLRNIDSDNKDIPQIPDFDSEIFESVDLKKQTERISQHYSVFPTSVGTNEYKQLDKSDS